MYNVDIFKYIELITGGRLNYCAQFPQKRGTADLWEELKDKGFISKDTKIEHFRVLFGIPIQQTDFPFKPIMWMKNGQLLRYFIENIYPKYVDSAERRFLTFNFFVNKRGKHISLPKSDKKRLEYSADFSTLEDLINDFYY